MPRQVKKITLRYNQMFWCETCSHWKQLQRTLNSWRRRHAANKNRYTYVVFPDSNVLYDITKDAVNTMICPKQYSTSLSNWKCVLRQCDNCPKYITHEYESSITTVAQKLKFQLYVLFLICSIHGLLGEGKFIYKLCEN